MSDTFARALAGATAVALLAAAFVVGQRLDEIERGRVISCVEKDGGYECERVK